MTRTMQRTDDFATVGAPGTGVPERPGQLQHLVADETGELLNAAAWADTDRVATLRAALAACQLLRLQLGCTAPLRAYLRTQGVGLDIHYTDGRYLIAGHPTAERPAAPQETHATRPTADSTPATAEFT